MKIIQICSEIARYAFLIAIVACLIPVIVTIGISLIAWYIVSSIVQILTEDKYNPYDRN